MAKQKTLTERTDRLTVGVTMSPAKSVIMVGDKTRKEKRVIKISVVYFLFVSHFT